MRRVAAAIAAVDGNVAMDHLSSAIRLFTAARAATTRGNQTAAKA